MLYQPRFATVSLEGASIKGWAVEVFDYKAKKARVITARTMKGPVEDWRARDAGGIPGAEGALLGSHHLPRGGVWGPAMRCSRSLPERPTTLAPSKKRRAELPGLPGRPAFRSLDPRGGEEIPAIASERDGIP